MAYGIPQADVCIICALEEEADAVEQVVFERCKVAFTTSGTEDGRFVYRSTTILNKKQEPLTLFLLCQTRPGPMSAALDIRPQLQVFQPSFVGMSGICAGDKRHTRLGDLVVAEHAYHFEAGKVTLDPEGNVIHHPEGITYSLAEPVLQYARTFGAWKRPVAELKKRLLPIDGPTSCAIALMASGMAVRSDDPFKTLQRQHRKTWALDMEAATFYLALRAFPHIDGLVVKGVADYADLSKDDTYHAFAARASAIYLLSFIQEYVTADMLLRRRRQTLPVFSDHDQLLATKFHRPASPHVLVPRPRLTSLLNKGLHFPLTLLSAPAGFGKTTLLSEWVQSSPVGNAPVAWVSLDEADNEPVRFWTCVFRALEACQPGLCRPLLAYLYVQQALPFQSILTTFINASLQHPEPLLLILDDYHMITEQAVHTSLVYLVEHLPAHLHVILSTRVDPPWPLARWRVRGRLLEIRTDQLRCTSQEANAFLTEVMGLALATDTLQQVQSRTEGWLAGLQLAALSLRECTDPTDLLAALHGSQRSILDYLTDEVLRQQPTTIQTFLLHTALLERLNWSLCDAVMQQDGSQETLEYLEQANLFVVALDGQRCWYRYHILFAEALRSRLERSQATMIPVLHLRASQWYEEQGHFNEAVQHALQARAWERAATLIEQVASMQSYRGNDTNLLSEEHFFNGLGREKTLPANASRHEAMPLLRWLKLLPLDAIRPHPYLCMIHAQMSFLVAPPATLEAQQQAGIWLQEAEMALKAILATQKPGSASGAETLLASILALRALISGYHGDGSLGFVLCQEALAHLSQEDIAIRAVVTIAESVAALALGEAVPAASYALEASTLGTAAGSLWQAIDHKAMAALYFKYQGNLHETWRLCQEARELAQEQGNASEGLLLPNISMAYANQADVLREWNHLDAAQDLVQQGIELAEQATLLTALDLCYAVLARIFLSRNKNEAAARLLAEAERVQRQLHNPYIQTVYLRVDRVRLWLICGERKRADRWAEEFLHKERQTSPFAQEREEVALVRIVLAQEKPEDALTRLPLLLERARKQQRWEHVIEMLLLQALAYQMCQQEQEALQALAQAVHLAEPGGYIRLFVDEGSTMAILLSKLQEQQQGPTPYLDRLLMAFPLETNVLK